MLCDDLIDSDHYPFFSLGIHSDFLVIYYFEFFHCIFNLNVVTETQLGTSYENA